MLPCILCRKPIEGNRAKRPMVKYCSKRCYNTMRTRRFRKKKRKVFLSRQNLGSLDFNGTYPTTPSP